MSLQNLFVTKLPRNITDADLEQAFIGFRPASAKVMLDAATGKSKGFGFVLFETVEQGKAAYDALNHQHVNVHGHGFTLNIFPSKHDGRAASMESNALYVRNVPVSMSKTAVEQFLGNFGTLVYCAMREDHYGSPVWVVYVEYDCIDCAKSTLQSLHGNNTYFFDAPAPILVKYADCDEAKKERRRRREEYQRDQTTQPSTTTTPPPAPAASHRHPHQNGGTASAHQLPPACVFPAPHLSSSGTSTPSAVPASPTRVNPVPPPATQQQQEPPRVSMFTPAPFTEGGAEQHGGPLEGSSMHSSSWSSSGSGMYRHNPYGQSRSSVNLEHEERGSPVRNNGSPVSHARQES